VGQVCAHPGYRERIGYPVVAGKAGAKPEMARADPVVAEAPGADIA
jgi:hypothetical protein